MFSIEDVQELEDFATLEENSISMKKISWGIIGCGDVAEIKSGPAFQKVAHSELLAVMRRDAAKAKDFAERHGVPQWYSDADELLKHPDINAVYIATPPDTHLEYALKAIKAGKHVYLEKPMTLTAKEAEVLLDAAQGSTKITVAHYRRELPVFLKVKELLEQKTIGDVRFVDLQILQPPKSKMIAETEENWRLDPSISGGGYFHDLAPHQIDLMYHFFGPIKQAHGFSGNLAKRSPADDVVNGIMVFESGVQFRGIWSFNIAEADARQSCTIYGSEGSISYTFFGDEVVLNTKQRKVFRFEAEPHVQQPMIEKTVSYFLGEGANPCSVEEGKIVMEVMDLFTNADVDTQEII